MSDEDEIQDWSQRDLADLDDEELLEYMNEEPKNFLGHLGRQLSSEIIDQILGPPTAGREDPRLTSTKDHGGNLQALTRRSRDRIPEHHPYEGTGLSDLIPTIEE